MTPKKEMDRVCGMWIELTEKTLRSDFGGTTFYFCEQGCKDKFDRDPNAYLKGFEGRGK